MFRVRGLALAQMGRLEDARAAIEKGLSLAEEQGLPYEVAQLLLAKARLAGDARGGPDSERGLQILDELGVENHPELVSSD